MVDRADVAAAAARLAGRVRRTPVVEVDVDAGTRRRAVTLKLELLQHTGSFKARGALNRLLSAPSATERVVAASGGNHGLAVAWAARELGLAAEVFVPETAPAVKVDRLRAYGADVIVGGAFYADALAASERRAAATGALVVHAYDDPAVVAGQGTVAVELAEQVPDADVVVVAVGGGGLVGGITTWLTGSRARVVAVEPERIPTLHAALAAGHPVESTWAASPPTPSGRAGSAASASRPPSRAGSSRCWYRTRPSWPPAAGCGRRPASPPSRAGRRRWPPC